MLTGIGPHVWYCIRFVNTVSEYGHFKIMTGLKDCQHSYRVIIPQKYTLVTRHDLGWGWGGEVVRSKYIYEDNWRNMWTEDTPSNLDNEQYLETVWPGLGVNLMECSHGHYQNNSAGKTHTAFHGLSDSDANCCLLGTASYIDCLSWLEQSTGLEIT